MSAFEMYNKRVLKNKKIKRLTPVLQKHPLEVATSSPVSPVAKKKPKISKNNWRESVILPNESSESISEFSFSDSFHKIVSPTKSTTLKPSTSGSEGFNVTERLENIATFMLAPITVSSFISGHWEKTPLHIKREASDYYKDLFSSKQLDEILRKNNLHHGRNVDIVRFENGERKNFTNEGRAKASELWDYYGTGCSIRILNPQTYSTKLQSFLAALQETFGCMVGANVYLTPPHSQGFAPHYDDIEAFVLQLEGKKHWKLYDPLDEESVLPRFSSTDFNADQLGKPIAELDLKAGDLLYFQRGIIHQGKTTDEHSLHVTISLYQKTSYLDLMEHMFKTALEKAAKDAEFREGLPINYLKHIGTACKDTNTTPFKKQIVSKVNYLMNKMYKKYADVDAAADQMGKQFMWDAIPPIAFKEEEGCTSISDGEHLDNGVVTNKIEITTDVKIRLFRYYCLQLVEEGDQLNVYYCTENARVYHGEEQQCLTADIKEIDAFRYLIKSYPNFVTIRSLPLKGDNAKLQFVSDLWEKNLLVTNRPFKKL